MYSCGAIIYLDRWISNLIGETKVAKFIPSVCQKIFRTIFVVIFVSAGLTDRVRAEVDLNKPSSINNSIEDNWIRATDDELAQQRGGFVLPNGMVIDISLERTVFQNGVETFSSFFQFSESGILIQNGSENLAPGSIDSALTTLIQNNLDDQVIKAINDINIEISNLQNIGLDNSHPSLDSILPILQ